MVSTIFVNLPVADVARSRAFFEALGYGVDERFSDERAVAVTFAENIVAMLLHRPMFEGFSGRPAPSADEASEVIIALQLESRDRVDEVVGAALGAGGSAAGETQDHGWMYVRGFRDPDGHMWEAAHMGEPPEDED